MGLDPATVAADTGQCFKQKFAADALRWLLVCPIVD
jgi:hypothetical protein